VRGSRDSHGDVNPRFEALADFRGLHQRGAADGKLHHLVAVGEGEAEPLRPVPRSGSGNE